MWNLKNKINEQTNSKQTHIDIERERVVARGEGVGELGERGEGTKKHNW